MIEATFAGSARWHLRQARESQLQPRTKAPIWLFLGGRGAGKTRAGGEWLKERVESGKGRWIHLVARTPADVRDTMLEGESGILSLYDEDDPRRPKYIPSQRCLIWPNGARALVFSSYEPDQLRGPQCDTIWGDEPAAWMRQKETWDNMMFGFRLGSDPRAMFTTTPRPTKLMKKLVDRAKKGQGIVMTHSTTYENIENLAPPFRDEILAQYEGTSLGRQELHAAMLEEVEGALWRREWIEAHRRPSPPGLKRVIVSVDPSTSETGAGNAAGIIVAGLGEDGHGYVLGDHTTHASPEKWARVAIGAFESHQADRVVAEGTQGMGLVKLTLQTVDPNIPVKMVSARRGKWLRAEPIASLYEQGKVHHCGEFTDLEDQLCLWTPGDDSPDNLDALVHALTELMTGSKGAVVVHAPM